jgi:TPP-dependent trihydroxycyclohexane-1,2-dione (THcHDO) dehydratase
MNQFEAIKILAGKAHAENTAIISEIGSQTVWLHGCGDHPSHLYLSGPMGMAPSVALGVAMARPDIPVLAICGDGATVMNFSALVSISHAAPKNLTIALMDNGVYDYTGALPSPSQGVNWPAMVGGLKGFKTILALDHISKMSFNGQKGPAFIHCPVSSMTEKAPPFPWTGPEIHKRFKGWCAEYKA